MTDWTIRRADVVDWPDRYDGPRFHALLCDAPYHLGPGGFMGERWDASGVSFCPETWKALTRHLHPGAFLFVFAGAINDDLISVAMRRAGLRKHYKVLTWVYGQGMPKATRVDSQVYDEDTGQYQFSEAYGEARHRKPSGLLRDRLPPTLLAGLWKGHRYGLQSLKPAIEPVLVFQKPYGGRTVDSITRTGAGVLNIDSARIATKDDLGGEDEKAHPFGRSSLWDQPWMHDQEHRAFHAAKIRKNVERAERLGRWPPNLALAHHPLCRRVGTRRVKGDKREGGNGSRSGGFLNVGADSGTGKPNGRLYGDEVVADWRCHPDCAVRRLAEQSGERKSGYLAAGHPYGLGDGQNVYGKMTGHTQHDTYGDTGTAARFFPQADWDVEVAEALLSGPGAYYTPKPSPKERDAGLCQRNVHPTVKPVALDEWLATLLLPPVQYGPRRLLVPFAGSGSEGLGAMMAGWERITLVEQSLNYCALAASRLAWWWPRVRQGMTEVKAVLDTWYKSDAEAQTDQIDELPLFAGISNPSFQTA
jgi:hypothetical protein